MASTISQTAPDAGHHNKSGLAPVARTGLPTPSPTPEPEIVHSQISGIATATPAIAITTPPPEIVLRPDEPVQSVEVDLPKPTNRQIAVLQRVINTEPTNHSQVLGFIEDSADKELQAVNIWRDQGCLLHEDYTDWGKHKREARSSFKRLRTAAKKFGVDDADIDAVESWDGTEIFHPYERDSNGKFKDPGDTNMTDMMEANDNPTKFHMEQYDKATEYILALKVDPHATHNWSQIGLINDRIKAQNETDGLQPSDRYAIDIDSLGHMMRSFDHVARKMREKSQDPQECVNEWNQGNQVLADFVLQHKYPRAWASPIPIPSVPVEQTTSTAPSTSSKTEVVDGCLVISASTINTTFDEAGVPKQIEGAFKHGFGMHILLYSRGRNNMKKYELIAASKFDKSAIKQYTTEPLDTGKASDLSRLALDSFNIGGVAQLSRDPTKSYKIAAKTLVLLVPKSGGKGQWFARSVLGARFGQNSIDKCISKYQELAGQKAAAPPDKRLKSAAIGSTESRKSGLSPKSYDAESITAMQDQINNMSNMMAQMMKRLDEATEL